MDKTNIKLAIAPIGWTNDDIPELGGDIPFEQCISEMALGGFRGSEVGNKYPSNPYILKNIWRSEGCRSVISGSVPILSRPPLMMFWKIF